MNTIKLIALLYLLMSVPVQSQWIETPLPIPANEQIYDMQFHANGRTAVASVSNKLFLTNDKGATWQQVASGPFVLTTVIWSGDTAYAGGLVNMVGTGILYISRDKGLSWEQQAVTASDGFTRIFVRNQQDIYMSCFNGDMYHSTNAGESWNIETVTNFILQGIAEFSGTLYSINPFYIYKKENKNTWDTQAIHGIYAWGDLFIINGTMYIGGDDYGQTAACITSSTDQGNSWNVENLGVRAATRSFCFFDSTMYAVGDYVTGESNYRAIRLNEYVRAKARGITVEDRNPELFQCIWKKKNGVWEIDYRIPTLSGFGFLGIRKTADFVYVFGTGRFIKQRIDSTTSVHSVGSVIDSYSLKQNNPNPFNPTTKITFSLPKKSMVSLKVFNSVGKEVATLVNGQQNAGDHTVDFNGVNLASGIYFYRLQTDAYTETKKMILMK